MHVFLSAVVILASASSPTQTAAAPASNAAEADDRIICQPIQKTGTRFEKRVCKRASEWRAMQEDSRAALQGIQSRPQINCNTPSGGAC